MRYLMSNKLIISLVFMTFCQLSVLGQTDNGKARIETSAHIDEMVALKKEHNKNSKKNMGFKIQIYYGSEKECYEIKEEFRSIFPDISTSILFSTPQWKLQVGNYRTRLEADNAIIGIKNEYPAAIVLATAIELK